MQTEFASAQDLLAHYMAVRRRIMAKALRPQRPPAVVKRSAVTAKLIYVAPIGPPVPLVSHMGATYAIQLPQVAENAAYMHVIVPKASPSRAKDIVRECCEEAGITEDEIKGERRSAHIVRARFKAIYRMSTELRWSLPRIGKYMGGRDHTSCLNALRKYRARLERGEA